MKYLKTDSIIIKIFTFICSFIIIFMSPCARYLDTYYIEKVNATGGVVAVEGAVVAWEWLMGLLASVGLGTVAYENREALAASYDEYLQAQIDTDMFVAHKVEDTCIQLYDKASDTVQSIPWEDYLNSIKGFHDVAVDELTDVYVKLAPSLLGTYEDFITSIFEGETVVPGISDYIEEQSIFFTDYDKIQNSDGKYDIRGRYYGEYEGIEGYTYYIFDPYFLEKKVYLLEDSIYYNYPHYSFFKYDGGSYSPCRVYCDMYDSHNNLWYYNRYINSIGEGRLNESYSINLPIFSSHDAARAAYNANNYSSALNYSRSIYDNITDNDDLPTIGRFGRELWEQVANAPDWGIGSYGDGAIVNDWATDLPFVGLDDLWNYALTAEDVYDKVIDDIINGVYDPTVDIPDIPDTYDDAWHDVIDKGWDDVIDNPVNNPAKDPTIPIDPDKPVNPDKPVDPDIPIDDVIEIPADSFIPAITDSIGDLNIDLKDKFPFCIPWDLYYLLTFLSNLSDDSGISTYSGDHGGGGHSREPVEKKNGAPVFRLPIVIERYGIEEYIIIDMSPFEPLSKISRLLFTLMFVYTLINWTVKIVSVRKDD